MANPVWTGTLSFGLVSVGVRMFSARERHGPTTHQFVRGTNSRIRYQRINEDTGKAVQPGDIVKGAQYGDDPDEYVILEPEELEQIQPGRSKTLEIKGFIQSADVDPLWYASTYYLGPDKSAAKPYQLLLTALQDSGRAGLGRMIMRAREHLVLITPQQGVLTASTLYWPDEVREPEDIMRPPTGDVDGKDLELASQLIDAMTTDWDPDAYTDEYEKRLEELIEAKTKGNTVSYEKPEPAGTGKVIALDDALRASLQQRRKDRAGKKRRSSAPAPRSSDDMPTKAKLMQQARELDVPGRSKMSRDELFEAVSGAN